MLCCILDFTEGLGMGLDWDAPALRCSWTGILQLWEWQPWDAPGFGCSSAGILTPVWNAEAEASQGQGKAEHEDALLLP